MAWIRDRLEFLSKLWNEHLKKIISQVLELVAKLIKAALDIYNKFISPIVKPGMAENRRHQRTRPINIFFEHDRGYAVLVAKEVKR